MGKAGQKRLNALYKNEKGFTLVELIVVLVILAILAAILIPQLLGWIDQARAKQDMINARNCMTAMQAELTKMYAFHKEGQAKGVKYTGNDQERPTVFPKIYGKNNNGDVDISSSDYAKAILATADEEPYIFIVGMGQRELYDTGNDKDLHKAYTCYVAMYMKSEDSKPLYFDGSEWTTKYLEKDTGDYADPNGVFTGKNVMRSTGVTIQYYIVANKSGYTFDPDIPGSKGSIWNYLRERSGSKKTKGKK